MPISDFQTTVTAEYLATLKQLEKTSRELVDAWDAFLEVSVERKTEVWVSPRVHAGLVRLRRDLVSLGEFHDA